MPRSSGSPSRRAHDDRSGVLLISCTDRPGLVAEVAGHLAGAGGNIVDAEQHTDRTTGRFFQRVAFETPTGHPGAAALAEGFTPVADRLGMDVHFHPGGRPTRVALLASRQRHCVLDLLHRHQAGELPMDPVAVVSNHTDVAEVAGWFDVGFHHLPITDGRRADQERELEALLESLDVELVVLARYMQVLSAGFCDRWAERCINIHHSFLPAFAGAQPYRQAHDRGVKLIGATAHYVTADLDAGPIISQGVAPVSHRDTVEDFVRRGRELETTVLADAVAAHLDHRLLVDGNRTVVFH
jgi:formyltetrahydrofolate deformylase